jgi:hypothetical protein
MLSDLAAAAAAAAADDGDDDGRQRLGLDACPPSVK